MKFLDKIKSVFGGVSVVEVAKTPINTELTSVEREARMTEFAALSPELSVNVIGIQLKMKKHEASLLTTDADGAEVSMMDDDFSYELEIVSTGENDDYPDSGTLYRVFFSSVPKKGDDFFDMIRVGPKEFKPFKFDVSEEFRQARPPSHLGDQGTPEHHILAVSTHSRNIHGEERREGMGFLVRKSDQLATEPKWVERVSNALDYVPD